MQSVLKSKLVGDVQKTKEDIMYISKNKQADVNTLNTDFNTYSNNS